MNWIPDLRLAMLLQSGIAIMMMLPMGIGYQHHETASANSFLFTIVLVLVITAVFLFATRKHKHVQVSSRDGFFLVTLSWVLATAFGALPLVWSGEYTNYSYAFFEIMSGFTTTGATVLADIEGCSRSILFWRSMTNWLGGMGFVVLFVALMPFLGAGGTHLFGAESVGPTKDKLAPKARTTAMALWLIYISFSVIETIMLLFGGLDLYEAVTVTFSTMSCAGFCVKGASIGAWGSAYVDVVVTVFMLIGGTNFALYFKMLTGKGRIAFKDGELRSYLAIFFFALLLCAFGLKLTGVYQSFGTCLRYAAFQLASIITTTGFATTDYCLWPAFPMFLVILMMFIGGCAGSTAGGMKVIRITTVLKLTPVELKRKIHPNGVFSVRGGDRRIEGNLIQSMAGFCATYLFIWILASLMIMLTGADIATSLASTILTLGNIGIGFGKVGPTGNFTIFPDWAKWLFSFLMLIGRLELYTVLVLFTKRFWSK